VQLEVSVSNLRPRQRQNWHSCCAYWSRNMSLC